MNSKRYVFSQIIGILPKRYFDRQVVQNPDNTERWALSHWSYMLVLIYGQITGCRSLREVSTAISFFGKRAYHLGMGTEGFSVGNLSKIGSIRSWRIYESFAYHMISLAQETLSDAKFVLAGKFYAFDSTTISLCMGLFPWADFRSTKSGIKLHTQYDIVTKIPTFILFTQAKLNDVKAMDCIDYEKGAFYIFGRGYFDLSRLFKINLIGAFFVIREKGKHSFEVEEGEDLMESDGQVIRDQTIRLKGKSNQEKYPAQIRRIVYYIPEHKRTFTFYTNDFDLSADNVAMLYKYRWQVELFFKWIKQHLQVQLFWGNTENAVRIQIYVAITTYCLMAILKRRLNYPNSVYELMTSLKHSLLIKENLTSLFERLPNEEEPLPIANFEQLFLPFDEF